MNRHITTLAATALLALGQTSLFGAAGEVFVTGSTWTGRVDGSTKYTGTSMAAAANACVAAMSSGTITLKNSGVKNGTISIKSNITLDGTGRTVSGSGTTGVVYAQNSSNVGGKNVKLASDDWYGIYFRTCNGQNATGNNGTANLSFRVDNCKGGTGYSLSVGSTSSDTSAAHGSHHVETYGISGVSWGTVTATDRGECGLLLNQSSGASGTSVNGTRCCDGGGYAGFRTANNNSTTTLGTVNSTDCGRGYFSVSGSQNCTITTVNATSCSSHGIWLQTTGNTRVNGGVVKSCNPCKAISSDLGGNVINAVCQ